MLRKISILLCLIAAIWSALWLYGRWRIGNEIEKGLAMVQEEGGQVQLGAYQVGGFPFGYKIGAQTLTATVPVEQADMLVGGVGEQTLTYEGGPTRIEASLFSMGEVQFSLPEQQRMVLSSPQSPEATTVDIIIGSESMGGVLRQEGAGRRTILTADSLRMIGLFSASDELNAGDLSFSALDFSTEVKMNGETLNDGPVEFSFSATDFVKSATTQPEAMVARFASEASAGNIRGEGFADTQWAEIKSEVEDLTVQFSSPIFLQFSAKDAATFARFPHAGDEGSREFTARVDVNELVLSEEFAALLRVRVDDAFRRFDKVSLEFSGTLKEGFALPDLVRAHDPLKLLENAKLTKLSLDGMGLEIEGAGSANFMSQLLSGEGEFEVRGVDGFIQNIVRAGILPPQQALMTRLMVQSISAEGRTPQHRRFSIRIADGMTYVNGNPIGRAPQLQ